MYIVFPRGDLNKGFFAFREILKQVPSLWPLLLFFFLPFSSMGGPTIDKAIADWRNRFHRCSYETFEAPEDREKKS